VPANGEATPANDEPAPPSGEAPPGAAAAAPARRRLSWPAAAVVCVAVAFGAAAWLLPFFSVRAYNSALAEVGQGKPDAAAVDARRAQRLDPLAVDPLVVLSLVEQRRGEPQLALDALNKAVKLQPDNWQVRYQLGLLLVNVLGRERAGVDELRRALSLNPRDALIAYQLRLHGGP
jgi:tetratricopeptide (TPR) repeat protein